MPIENRAEDKLQRSRLLSNTRPTHLLGHYFYCYVLCCPQWSGVKLVHVRAQCFSGRHWEDLLSITRHLLQAEIFFEPRAKKMLSEHRFSVNSGEAKTVLASLSPVPSVWPLVTALGGFCERVHFFERSEREVASRIKSRRWEEKERGSDQIRNSAKVTSLMRTMLPSSRLHPAVNSYAFNNDAVHQRLGETAIHSSAQIKYKQTYFPRISRIISGQSYGFHRDPSTLTDDFAQLSRTKEKSGESRSITFHSRDY
ncbi:hypothetical protein DFH09DRAFT_1095203 [Mycena vulgaris]|nr:hypothetical protein DFH09DRAFT_1095203 [Mycena vulgaris]